MLFFCSLTQIESKTTSEQIVATRCFCCCSLRPQQYRQTHSATPSRFTLPLKQPTDRLALSSGFDRIFTLSNGVFHVKHRFFYCFPVGILLFLLCILLVFLCFVLFCRIVGCVWSSALFVFIIFAALQECCFRFLSADGPLLFLLCQASDVGGRGIDVVLRWQ